MKPTRTYPRLGLLAAASALLIAGCGSGGATAQSSSSKSPITIGIIADMTGSTKTIGEQFINGSEAAAKVFGPIDGRPVKFVVRGRRGLQRLDHGGERDPAEDPGQRGGGARDGLQRVRGGDQRRRPGPDPDDREQLQHPAGGRLGLQLLVHQRRAVAGRGRQGDGDLRAAAVPRPDRQEVGGDRGRPGLERERRAVLGLGARGQARRRADRPVRHRRLGAVHRQAAGPAGPRPCWSRSPGECSTRRSCSRRTRPGLYKPDADRGAGRLPGELDGARVRHRREQLDGAGTAGHQGALAVRRVVDLRGPDARSASGSTSCSTSPTATRRPRRRTSRWRTRGCC